MRRPLSDTTMTHSSTTNTKKRNGVVIDAITGAVVRKNGPNRQVIQVAAVNDGSSVVGGRRCPSSKGRRRKPRRKITFYTFVLSMTIIIIYIYSARIIVSHVEDKTTAELTTSPPRLLDPQPSWNSSTPVNGSSSIPHILWFTHKKNILETKTPRQYYDNIQNTIARYDAAFRRLPSSSPATVQFLTDDSCLRTIDVMGQTHAHLSEISRRLGQYFTDEKQGSYKSDICRLAALYLYGGYYFDVDMEVIQPVIAETWEWRLPPLPNVTKMSFEDYAVFSGHDDDTESGNESRMGPMAVYDRMMRLATGRASAEDTAPPPVSSSSHSSNSSSSSEVKWHNITFLTVLNQPRNYFFQSFLGCVPHHPIIERALNLTVELYERRSSSPGAVGELLVGPHTLYRSYSEVTGVDPKFIGEEPPLPEPMDAEMVYSLSQYEEPFKEYSPEWDAEMDELYDEFFLNVLGGPGMVELTDYQKDLYYSSYLLQEEHRNPDSVQPNLPPLDERHNCNYIVHDNAHRGNSSQPPTIYFNSRILGSSNCPIITPWDRVHDFIWNDHFATCGGGTIGNGRCTRRHECCSPYGWCGTSPAHCVPREDSDDKPTFVSKFVRVFQPGTCGEGQIGNGKCPHRGDCCSQWGWCGTTQDHCMSLNISPS